MIEETYSGLAGYFGEWLFSADIMNPSDQLIKIERGKKHLSG